MDYPAEKDITLEPVNAETIAPIELTGLSENLYEPSVASVEERLGRTAEKDDFPWIHSFTYIDGQLDVYGLYG